MTGTDIAADGHDAPADEGTWPSAPAQPTGSPPHRPLPYVLGGRLRLRPSLPTTLSLAVVAVVVALPLRGLYLGTGSSMEEGFMLVFPKRMLAGDVPNVDFLHLYGPGALHTLMGWYRLFGYTLESERTFGLLQHLLIITAVYAACRAWGHRLAVIAAIAVTLLVLTPIGLSALAWEGAVGLAAWAVVFAVRALHVDGRERAFAALAGGALAGYALSFRPDLVLAIGIAAAVVLWLGRSTRSWRGLLVGGVVGLTPMWIHLAVAGIGPSWRGMVIEPVRDLRPGRELPRPPSWDKVDGALQAVVEDAPDRPWWRFPALAANHQLFVWFWAVVLVAFGTFGAAIWLIRRHGGTRRRTVLVVAAALGFGMLPQALQRPDSTHLAWGSCISLGAVLPALVAELALLRRERRRDGARSGAGLWRVDLVAAVSIAAVLFVVAPFYTYRAYLLYSRISVGNKVGGFEVSRDGRSFYVGNVFLQRASQAAIDQLDASMQPGDRLLVGPADLSRTIYSDVVFYYLFPELTPATYFIEMDPGLADAPGSRLADDVASADWVLLTNFWTGWYEPNTSSEFGSPAPNQVVADRFCLVGDYEDALVLLYHRCERGDGVDPATIGIGPARRADMERERATREGA